jgi:hypothetical protein
VGESAQGVRYVAILCLTYAYATFFVSNQNLGYAFASARPHSDHTTFERRMSVPYARRVHPEIRKDIWKAKFLLQKLPADVKKDERR